MDKSLAVDMLYGLGELFCKHSYLEFVRALASKKDVKIAIGRWHYNSVLVLAKVKISVAIE